MLDEQNKHKRHKKDDGTPTKASDDSSAFQALFAQRAQGFRIDFSFRNAPPRPPVGPCFVGQGLDGQLQELAQYKNHNAVEVNHSWKLHAEQDLGVPLAPSAMDLSMYKKPGDDPPLLHPDDEALLDWKGSMGDTAAEDLQKTKDQARAAARLALQGKAVPVAASVPQFQKKKGNRKDFSRVLDHGLVFFMKKTTYLSNDYSRKVHDFTSLAETKARTAADLNAKQRQLDRSPKAVAAGFNKLKLVHPSGNKNRKPVSDLPLLPNVEHWGHAYTHVVLDNPPKNMEDPVKLEHSFVAHVEQRSATARMTCQILVPQDPAEQHRSIAQYDLDVVPLKESEDSANTNFCLWISKDSASYLPIPSRVQLSTGRPSRRSAITTISRKSGADQDEEYLERMAQVNRDVSESAGGDSVYKHNSSGQGFGNFDDDDDDDDSD